MAVDPNIKRKADDIRTKVYGSEVRESLASGLEAMSEDVVNNTDRQTDVESQFQEVIENTTDKDVISAPEIIAARNGEPNLKSRLDKEKQEVTAQLAQTADEVNQNNTANGGMFYKIFSKSANGSFHKKGNFKKISDFSDTSKWTDGTSDSINTRHGKSSLRLSGTNAPTSTVDLEPIDATGKITYLELFVPKSNQMGSINLDITLFNEWAYVEKKYVISRKRESSEWVKFAFNVDACEMQNGMTREKLKAVDRIQIQAHTSGSGIPMEVSLDFLGMIENQQSEGYFTLSFDDGNKTDITNAKPIMDKYGYKGVAYVVPTLLGNAGLMTVDDVHQLHESGWDVASHGYEHKYLDSVSGQELIDDIVKSRDWLLEHGFYNSAMHYCAPAGLMSLEAGEVLRKYGFKTSRSDLHADRSTPVNQLETFPPADPYRIMPVGMYAETPTLDQLETIIDKAIETKSWVNFMFHGVGGGSVPMSEERFENIIDLFHSKNANVVTLSDLSFLR